MTKEMNVGLKMPNVFLVMAKDTCPTFVLGTIKTHLMTLLVQIVMSIKKIINKLVQFLLTRKLNFMTSVNSQKFVYVAVQKIASFESEKSAEKQLDCSTYDLHIMC